MPRQYRQNIYIVHQHLFLTTFYGQLRITYWRPSEQCTKGQQWINASLLAICNCQNYKETLNLVRYMCKFFNDLALVHFYPPLPDRRATSLRGND